VEKRMDATQCSGEANCSSGSKCLAHNLWTDLNDQVQSFLMDKSLEDVLNGKKFLSKPNKNTENSLLIATG
jgi:Rrf2 family iron-sulfur cluster assembly transcriptional regulator